MIRPLCFAKSCLDLVEQAVDAAARLRRDGDHGRPLAQPPREVPLRLDDLELRHVPLGQHRQGGAARLAGDVGDGEILLDDPLRRVEEDERDIGALGGLESSQLAVVLDSLALLAAPPQAGRVDEHEGRVAALQHRVDRVARRARDLGDDHPLAADELVEERRLADVRPPEDRDPDRLGADRDLARAGQARDDLVEQVAGAVAVQPRQRPRLPEPEPMEHGRVGIAARIVDLVREHDHGALGGAEDHGELLVARRDPGAGIDDEQHEIGLVDRGLGLLGDLGAEHAALDLVDTAGVDEAEPGA